MQPSPLRRIRHLRGKLFIGTTKVDYANPNMILRYPYIWPETLILERYAETAHNLRSLFLCDILFRENIIVIMLNLTFRYIMFNFGNRFARFRLMEPVPKTQIV